MFVYYNYFEFFSKYELTHSYYTRAAESSHLFPPQIDLSRTQKSKMFKNTQPVTSKNEKLNVKCIKTYTEKTILQKAFYNQNEFLRKCILLDYLYNVHIYVIFYFVFNSLSFNNEIILIYYLSTTIYV